jgi:two-component system phosphate regulon sensor histidine kinase PhoR
MTQNITIQEIIIVIFALVLTFFGGIGLSSLIWRRRKKRVLRNLEKLITTEQKDYTESPGDPTAKDIEEAFRTLFVARKQELQRLQQLENYRRDYIGNVAHELKTPLFSIQGYIETVLDEPEMDEKTRQNFLKKADKNATRLGQIVSDLDSITKFESGFLSIDLNPFNMLELIHQVMEDIEIQAAQKEISLSVQIKTDFTTVLGDRSRIRQVLVNLGYNSIKYGKQKGSTHFIIYDTGEKIIVEVADNGIGIPTQHIGRVFERFYRVDADRNRETGGSGLGLSICKHIIEAHGETIKVISSEGAGSSFTFALPKHK